MSVAFTQANAESIRRRFQAMTDDSCSAVVTPLPSCAPQKRATESLRAKSFYFNCEKHGWSGEGERRSALRPKSVGPVGPPQHSGGAAPRPPTQTGAVSSSTPSGTSRTRTSHSHMCSVSHTYRNSSWRWSWKLQRAASRVLRRKLFNSRRGCERYNPSRPA